MAEATTLENLDALIARLTEARAVAANGAFFESYIGAECARAAAKLFASDELETLADDIEHDAGGGFDDRDVPRVTVWNFVHPGWAA